MEGYYLGSSEWEIRQASTGRGLVSFVRDQSPDERTSNRSIMRVIAPWACLLHGEMTLGPYSPPLASGRANSHIGYDRFIPRIDYQLCRPYQKQISRNEAGIGSPLRPQTIFHLPQFFLASSRPRGDWIKPFTDIEFFTPHTAVYKLCN